MPGPSTDRPAPPPRGDFEAFFRAEFARLLAVAVSIVGDREEARELVQESLLRTYRAWTEVSVLDWPGGWTHRVLVNLCIDVHRRHGRERTALSRSAPATAVAAADPPAMALWDAVRLLPSLQRAAVVLHYVDDLSVDAVAAVLGVSAGSVKTSLSRARARLAPAVASQLAWEERS